MDALLPVMVANAVVAVGLMAIAFGVSAMRRPRAGHAAWLVVLLKLVTPPLVVIPVAWTAAKVVADQPQTLPPPPAVESEQVVPCPTVAVEQHPIPVVEPPAVPVPANDDNSDDPRPVPAVLTAIEPEQEPVNPWRVAFFVWLAGTATWTGIVAVRVLRFRRFVATATPVDVETFALARAVAARFGLRQVPAVSFVDGPVSPMLWAVVGRPRVLLPRRLWAGFDADHREAVLAHELAHLARGDHWVRRFELVVLALYWWCPVAWVAVRELRRAEEACCDERVLGAVPGRAAAYAEALVETVAYVNRPGWVPLASGGAVRASDLKRRITMILNSTDGTRPSAWLPMIVGLVGLAALPLAPGLADDKRPTPVSVTAEDPPTPPPEPPAVRWRAVSDDKAVAYWSNHVPQSCPANVPSAMLAPPTADGGRLKDELELLEAQLHTKEAHIRAAERGAKSASAAFDRIKKVAASGTVSQEEVAKAEEAFDKAMSELDIKKAELQEHMVRVKQAKRRLEATPATRYVVADPAVAPAATLPRSREWTAERTPPPVATTRPAGDVAPARPPASTAAPARSANALPTPSRSAAPDPAPRFRPPLADATEDREGTRATLDRRLNDLMDQYEENQRALQKMQKQQADLKKMLDDLGAERKKLSGELPTPARR